MKHHSFLTSLCLLICFSITAQNVGIGTTSPLEKLSVGSTSQFRIDANGNITRINNVPYSFPSVQAAPNQFLKNDGAGNMTWSDLALPPKPVVRTFQVGAFGLSAWTFDNPADYHSGNNQNPALVLVRGLTYQFNITAGHPFVIALTNGGAPYTVGITNNGTTFGTVTFTVPLDAPATMHYYCAVPHPGMDGTITIL